MTLWLPNRAEDHIQRRIFELGRFYEQEMLTDMRMRLRPGDLVLDVGAYLGNHSVFLAGVCKARVVALEPNPASYGLLETNVRDNDLQKLVRTIPAAAGSKEGMASIASSSAQNLGGTRLRMDSDGSISVVAIDELDLPAEPAAIKIDVEGMEMQVLAGAMGTITKVRPLLYVEVTTAEALRRVLDLLGPLGYGAVGQFNATPTVLFSSRQELLPMVNAQIAQSYHASYSQHCLQIERLGAVGDQLERTRVDLSTEYRTYAQAGLDEIRAELQLLNRGVTDLAAALPQLEANMAAVERRLGTMDARLGALEADAPGDLRKAVEALVHDVPEAVEERGNQVADAIAALRESLEAQYDATGVLTAQVRRVAGDVFSLKLRTQPGAPTVPTEPPRRSTTPARPPSPAHVQRKLRKLVRDPHAFFRDSQRPLLRQLGGRVLGRVARKPRT